jgi:hypothetical protein
MGLFSDPKCVHGKTRGDRGPACTACKKGKTPMSGTLINGKLAKPKRRRNTSTASGDNKRFGRHNGWG